jgi:uncharacterized membrane protein
VSSAPPQETDPAPHPVHSPVHPRHHRLRNTLIAGLLTLAPLFVTAYVLRLLFRFMDGIFAPLIDRALGAVFGVPRVHVPGLGALLTLTVIFFLGWLSASVVGREILEGAEGLIRRIPIAKTIYGATKQVLDAVSRDQESAAFKRVVLIEYPRRGLFGLGFVTGGEARWPSGDPRVDGELVPVFVPHTPNPTGGFLLLLPPHEIIEVDISIEEGIRMVVSGGILQPARLLSGRQPAPLAAPVTVPAGVTDLEPDS